MKTLYTIARLLVVVLIATGATLPGMSLVEPHRTARLVKWLCALIVVSVLLLAALIGAVLTVGSM